MNDCGFQLEHTYTALPDGFYTLLDPLPVTAPEMIMLNEDLASAIGLDFSTLDAKDQAAMFSGNTLPAGAKPFAQAYAGHQFGHFTMLGDGRAHTIGEQITPDHQRLDIQFKGSGRTPYSRNGDGRAALGPMLREYMISEAMHALGIPTTRALAIVRTGEDVIREDRLPGAILTRVARSHIRVGTFEFAAAQRDPALVETLLDYAIQRHDPDLQNADNKALAFLRHVMDRQADLVVHWMRVGFIHGVMNTDNMAIAGESIDYGPCAFIDNYDPGAVFSSIDHMGRYAFSNQPVITQWNIARLAEALLPLIHTDMDNAITLAEDTVNGFSELYQQKWLSMMRSKLGLFKQQAGDDQLISDLLDWMQTNHADYTNIFRDLSHGDGAADPAYHTKPFVQWYARWQARLGQEEKPLSASLALMQQTNPAIIPRNHNVEHALNAAVDGNIKPFRALLSLLKDPYTQRDALTPYQSPPPPQERVYQTFCGT